MLFPDVRSTASIGDYLREFRSLNRLSRAATARLLRISAESVRKYEVFGARSSDLMLLRIYHQFLYRGGRWNDFAEVWGYLYRMDPAGETTPDPAVFESIRDWLRAVRLHQRMTQARFAAHVDLSYGRVRFMETRRIRPPPVMVLRKIRDAIDMPNHILIEALQRTHEQYYGTGPVDDVDKYLFWKLISTPTGSRSEQQLRNQIFDRHRPIADKVARRWCRNAEHRDELTQRCSEAILSAILNHVPTRPFTRYAFAWCRGAMLRAYFEDRYPHLDRQTRYHVVRIDGYIRKRTNTGGAYPSYAEISDALKIPLSKVKTLVRLADIQTVSLDLPIGDGSGTLQQIIADPTSAGFTDVELSASITAAIADLPSPEIALQVIVLHLVEGIPLARVAAQVHLTVEEADSLLARTKSRLRSTLATSE